MSSCSSRCINVKRKLPKQSGNLEFKQSKPGTSKATISEKVLDKTANETIFEKNGSKQLAVIPLNIIESRFRNLVSLEIDKDICQLIANHCCQKLREILKSANDYMTACGRLKFTADDFNKGLLFYGECPAICCESLPTPVKGKRKRKTEKMPQNSPDPQHVSIGEIRLNDTCLFPKRKIKKKLQDSPDPQHVFIDEIWLNDISPFSVSIDDLPDEQQEYFKALVDVLLYNIEEAGSMFTDDLQINPNINQLVPCLVDFFCEVMNEFNCDFVKMAMLFKFLDAFLRNGHLYFGQDSYMNVLSHALLDFLVADLPNSDQFIDCWTLKDIAANVLAFIILERSRDQHLFFEVLYFLRSAFSFRNSLKSHYGALAALNSVGAPGIYLLLPSYVHKFHKYAQAILAKTQNRLHIHMMQGQIVRSYHLLVDFYFKNEIRKPKFNSEHHFNSKFFVPNYLKDIKVFPIITQSIFSDFFGEALLPSFPLLNFVSHLPYLRKSKKGIVKKVKQITLKSYPQLMEMNM